MNNSWIYNIAFPWNSLTLTEQEFVLHMFEDLLLLLSRVQLGSKQQAPPQSLTLWSILSALPPVHTSVFLTASIFMCGEDLMASEIHPASLDFPRTFRDASCSCLPLSLQKVNVHHMVNAHPKVSVSVWMSASEHSYGLILATKNEADRQKENTHVDRQTNK